MKCDQHLKLGGNALEWPEHFDESCPPRDAVPAEGNFYRLVKKSEISENDVRSGWEKNPSRYLGLDSEAQCTNMGLSVFGEIEDIEYVRKSCGGMKNRSIALGPIDGAGQMKHTPSGGKSHHTWWRPVNDLTWRNFEVVA